MSFRNLDINGDWLFGAGLSDYVTEQKEIELNVKTRLQSFLGDCFWDTAAGIDYWNLLNYRGQDRLENQIKETIINTPGIIALDEVNISLNAQRELNLNYKAYTIYSQTIEGTLPLNQVV